MNGASMKVLRGISLLRSPSGLNSIVILCFIWLIHPASADAAELDAALAGSSEAALVCDSDDDSNEEQRTEDSKPKAEVTLDQQTKESSNKNLDQDSNSHPAEEDEVCRPVIKVLVRRRDNAAVTLLRKDLRDGLLDEVAIDIQVFGRLKDQPKIKVPISPERYRVWNGYHSGIRRAILRTAAEYAKNFESPGASVSSSTDSVATTVVLGEDAPSSLEEPVDGATREEGYPTRTRWWTVNGKHPEKEGMVEHLSGGPHKDQFDLAWLETLTREELHALHSDDHEKKVNWDYARKPSAPAENEDSADSQNDSAAETAAVE